MRSALFRAVLLIAGFLLWASSARAVPIQYEVEVGSEQGFNFSYIHAATGFRTINGIDYYMLAPGGGHLFRLTGTITGSFDSGVLTLDNDITLNAQGLNAFAGQDWTLEITGGTLSQTAILDSDTGIPLFEGSFTYVLTNDNNGAETTSGEFFFHAIDPAGSPNSLDETLLGAWGNNWDNGTDPVPVPDGNDPQWLQDLTRLGVDIRAQGTVIPEPTGFIVFGIGAVVAGAGAAAARRREGNA